MLKRAEILVVSLIAVVSTGCASARKPQLNIVFILADDLGWRDVGCYGSEIHDTPNIDRLASQGMRFTNAYANAPNCAPTRACLMTGQYGPRHGIYTVGSSKRGKAERRKLIPTKNTTTLDERFVTLPEVLRRAGYTNGHFGKWHLGDDPTSQGFDVNVGGSKSGHPKSYFSPYRNADLPDGEKGEYLTDRLTAEAIKFMQANRDRPFFLYLSHFAVHTPIQGRPDLVAKYRERKTADDRTRPGYAAMVESVDQSVGRILAALDDLNLKDNTVVFFFSDNGGHASYTSMAPLRGSKGMLYEGGIREPLIVRWPGVVAAGSRCDVPVIGTDIFPTILEMAGIEKPASKTLDGESIVPLLTHSGALKRHAIYWHFPAYLEAYRRGQAAWRTTPAGAVRIGDYKLIEFFEDGALELYNLRNDIGETENLAERKPEKTAELLRDMRAWRDKVNAPVPTRENPAYDPDSLPARLTTNQRIDREH